MCAVLCQSVIKQSLCHCVQCCVSLSLSKVSVIVQWWVSASVQSRCHCAKTRSVYIRESLSVYIRESLSVYISESLYIRESLSVYTSESQYIRESLSVYIR